MIYKLVIHRTLPDLNDVIDGAHKVYHYRGSARNFGDAIMKRHEQARIENDIRRQLHGVHIKKPVRLTYALWERDKKRDWDNVLSIAMKYCNDALVRTGVLQNDTQKWVRAYGEPVLMVDRENPRIEITIEELEEE